MGATLFMRKLVTLFSVPFKNYSLYLLINIITLLNRGHNVL